MRVSTPSQAKNPPLARPLSEASPTMLCPELGITPAPAVWLPGWRRSGVVRFYLGILLSLNLWGLPALEQGCWPLGQQVAGRRKRACDLDSGWHIPQSTDSCWHFPSFFSKRPLGRQALGPGSRFPVLQPQGPLSIKAEHFWVSWRSGIRLVQGSHQ